MQFSLFVHMERSSPEQSHSQLYEEFLALCELADAGGMTTIWTGEHHGMDFTIAPNPFITLVDVARVTRNVRLGTGTIVAPYWHPIRLAGEAAMADVITGGRLEMSIARGAYTYEYERLMPGMDAWEAGQRLRETVPMLRKLWAGDYAHDGEFYQFPSTSSMPTPVQQPGPPMWIAARDPSSHEFAVDNGCNVQVTPLWQGDEEIESLMERFNAAVEKSAQERPKIMLLQHGYVGADKADVEFGVNALSRFYGDFGAWFANKRPVSHGIISPLNDEDRAKMPALSPDALRETLSIGTAPEVIERLKHYEALGFDEYSLWLDNGMTFDAKRAMLDRFMTEVMPAFS
jgi:flavin-dependent trigonelline monooxygenase, oxygenase component